MALLPMASVRVQNTIVVVFQKLMYVIVPIADNNYI